jgi:uncharacterized membrane protein YtjA (UPF0391 family)
MAANPVHRGHRVFLLPTSFGTKIGGPHIEGGGRDEERPEKDQAVQDLLRGAVSDCPTKDEARDGDDGQPYRGADAEQPPAGDEKFIDDRFHFSPDAAHHGFFRARNQPGNLAQFQDAARRDAEPPRWRFVLDETLREREMLYWALVFFVVAIIAAVLGFGGIAGAAAGIAKILFFIFLVLLVLSLLFGWGRRGSTGV